MKQIYVLTGIAALAGIAAAVLAGHLLPDRGIDRLILRLGLAVIVLIAAAAFLLFKRSQQPPEEKAKPLKAGDELEALLSEAETKLGAAKLRQGSGFADFLTIFLIGPEGSAKTTTVIHSGLEAELLTGQVFQESAVLPTKLVNVWYTRTALLVESGAKLFSDSDSWLRLIRRMMPGSLGTVMGKAGRAGRAALVCVDIEKLLRPGAAEYASALAHTLHDRLVQFSQTLGISTPVYVLFTKADRVPFFMEYVQHLSDEESHQVVGVTLPLGEIDPRKPYAEEQSGRLSQSFNRLFYSLCDHRPELLSRENERMNAAAIYEFPREFRKMRTVLVTLLLELCRPSQLTIGPFLRGYYFSGVRPVLVQESTAQPSSRPVMQQGFQGDPGATSMFRMGQSPAPMLATETAGIGQTKKVPQWIFVERFFQSVLLNDRAALGLSGTSTKTGTLRRILFGGVALICLCYSVALLISYFHNRDLEQSAITAANGISLGENSSASAPPSIESLGRLDFLRQSFERLAGYDRHGPPLGLRWGLYSGTDLYPDVRSVYFEKFRQILLAPTQAALLGSMRALPAASAPGDSYQYAYDTLKTYLITTSHHEKSTRRYLAPMLGRRWSEKRNVDAVRGGLAGKQFDLYSDELAVLNPFSSDSDKVAVNHARQYLSSFKGMERVYQFMLAEANGANPSLNFNRSFRGSSRTVVNDRDVPGAFSKDGWAAMQNAFKNADRYFAGEQWVLGEETSSQPVERPNVDLLRARYSRDFIKVWRDYLQRSAVVRYKGLPDASDKLRELSVSDSPLLAMFWLASKNTAVDSPEVQKAFKALYSVVPAGSGDQYFSPVNAEYMKSLASLQLSLESIANQQLPPTEAAADPVLKAAAGAELIARQMSQQFGVDAEAHLDATVTKLLEDPITQVQSLMKGAGPAELNAKGKKLCDQFHLFSTKYPFNPRASAEASLADVNSVFRPKEGALWTFYAENLQKALIKKGSLYVPDSSAAVHLTPSFVGFFNRAAAFSEGLYPGGAAEPRLAYSLKPGKMEGIDHSTLTIDGQTLAYSGSATPAKQFIWPGSVHEVKSGVFTGVWFDEHGLWSVFKFFYTADKWQPSGTVATVDWFPRIRNTPMMLADGSGPLTLRYELDMGANPPVFQKGYLSSLACTAEVAK